MSKWYSNDIEYFFKWLLYLSFLPARSLYFWVIVCKMVRPVPSEHCLSCLASPVCDVAVLSPNGWMDKDAIWYGGRPLSIPHCVRWEPISPLKGTASLPLFGPSVMIKWSPISVTAELLLLSHRLIIQPDWLLGNGKHTAFARYLVRKGDKMIFLTVSFVGILSD